MSDVRRSLELLAPARNLETGLEAIRHGADAVFIGGPGFGARAAAGNPVADIETLARAAHRFGAHVYVTFNTILFDQELAEAERLVRQLYEAGADALIVQDMGLLQLDLPPIALHASTQMDNRQPEKLRFLQDVGFSQAVLARELTLGQIRSIAEQTALRLEFFVHGALCVSYSGQCYISHAKTGRSANRGECAQLCRLPWTLEDEQGRVLSQDQHLLSLKDMNQTDNLQALVEAGISSFKIEGRLKDVAYVKNVTAHYRQALDRLLAELPGYQRASAGHTQVAFTPQPQKSFNRGATGFFLRGRHGDITAFQTPKFIGEPIGQVRRLHGGAFELDTTEVLNNGDGLCFFAANGELVGTRLNRVEGHLLHPAEPLPGLQVGMTVYRNLDQAFEKQLARPSAERRLWLDLTLAETAEGFELRGCDECGVQAAVACAAPKDVARDEARALATIREQLGKLGNTLFELRELTLQLSAGWFVPVSQLNALRRELVEKLEAARAAAYVRPPRLAAVEPPVPYPLTTLGWQGNVSNAAARRFYERHGVTRIEAAYECDQERGEVALMTSKHCLRYSFGQCPKEVRGVRPQPWLLRRGGDAYPLHFDCKRCEMQVLGSLKKKR